ncbi:uncharacterized protein LOC143056913 [Mytilus galloprovincialis]|uniref:uncharacterized protein LOC143056913 n=1 Tax=Mytilus galloprovincialis TaxID=29158 RepID=UPI003F7C610B
MRDAMYRYHTNRQGLVPLGKGSLCSSILKISSNTRDRAVKANLVEIAKTERLKSIFDQQKKETDVLTDRVINRTCKSLKEKTAWHHVLNTNYSTPYFKTLQHGFNKRDVYTPKTSQHIKVETKVYDIGWDKSIFKTDICRRLLQTDPRRKQERERKLLLNKSRRKSQIVIDRQISTSAFYRLLQDPSNIHEYKYERKPTLVTFQDELNTLKEKSFEKDILTKDDKN